MGWKNRGGTGDRREPESGPPADRHLVGGLEAKQALQGASDLKNGGAGRGRAHRPMGGGSAAESSKAHRLWGEAARNWKLPGLEAEGAKRPTPSGLVYCSSFIVARVLVISGGGGWLFRGGGYSIGARYSAPPLVLVTQ